jgi:hypothetical protein
VVAAIHRQADLLLHGLGDLHPTSVPGWRSGWRAGAVRADLDAVPATGAGAIELALKTSHLATGRAVVVGSAGATTAPAWGAPRRLLEFLRSVHVAGAGPIEDYGVVPSWTHRSRASWSSRCRARGAVEPLPGFLAGLRDARDRAGAPLVVDEVFTGLDVPARCGCQR